MGKKRKWIAILWASILMAAGASITAFASEGWKEEVGKWRYQDEEGEYLTDTWKKSDNQYYYLDSDGVMVRNSLLEIDGELYYVDADGVRVTEKWIFIPNDGQWEAEVENIWYYFDSTGKAYRDGRKTIASRIHIFDEEARALSGWQYFDGDGEDDGDLYYLGGGDECYAYTGWHLLEPMEDTWPEEGEYDSKEWFYFKDNGKAYKEARKLINGHYYAFDKNGVMLTGWAKINSETEVPSYYAEKDSLNVGIQQTGWTYTHAWSDPDGDGDQYWHYLNDKGIPFNVIGNEAYPGSSAEERDFSHDGWKDDGWEYKGEDFAAKRIKGETYLFDGEGKMQTGLFLLSNVPEVGTNKRLGAYEACDDDSGEGEIYYFNMDEGDKLGQMMTGKQTIKIDDENVYFNFKKDGSAYRNIIADGALYGSDGARVDMDSGNDVVELGSNGISSTIYVKGKPDPLPAGAGDLMIVSTSGRVKKKGHMKIDGVEYTIENYIATETEEDD